MRDDIFNVDNLRKNKDKELLNKIKSTNTKKVRTNTHKFSSINSSDEYIF